jgi:hypothetical protein
VLSADGVSVSVGGCVDVEELVAVALAEGEGVVENVARSEGAGVSEAVIAVDTVAETVSCAVDVTLRVTDSVAQ